ncbi:MAG TPA: MbnP family protein [Opitutaceae bacterium]|nr:MbnP family protein [Opitutaceae bacterium]
MRFLAGLLLLALPLRAAEVELRFVPRWHDAEIAVPSADVANEHEQTLRITRFAALISGVTLLRANGDLVRLDGQYGFIDAADGRLAVALHNVPAGDYAGIEYRLGVPPEINHADPSRWPAGHALNPLVNRLHWGWQGGFVFLALEGRWHAADASEHGFSYHLATDAHLMTARFLSAFKVEGDTTIRFALDLARVLGRRELVSGGTVESTHSGNGDLLAGELATSVERAMFWLEAAPTTLVAANAPATTSTKAGETKPSGATTPFAFTVPAGFPQPSLPADNPLTVEGVTVGRRLFGDRRLSGNGRQSCADCHSPARAFSDRVAFSRGADGKSGARNAMPLTNLAWHPAYAWDGGQPRIRDQTVAAMTNPVEMHADLARVAATLEGDPHVREDFAAAFGTPEVTPGRIALALEQYLLTQVSADSKFDRAMRGDGALTEDEKRGFALFVTEYDPARGQRGADCFHCHGGTLFSDFAYKNNGLDLAPRDAGRAKATQRTSDEGAFKTPSLRNVAVTAPYMHDGRFATLEEVVAHYDHGVQRSANLDPNLAKHPADGMKLNAAEQRELVAFLRTLTDPRFERARGPQLPDQPRRRRQDP